jgi:uncharacterized protein (DUF433 family)
MLTTHRDTPRYTVTGAARSLGIPASTVRSWVRGPTRLIDAGACLSFTNLVELQVLRAIRARHNIPMSAVRTALVTTSRQLGGEHPLATRRFETDGVDLFLRELDQLYNVSKGGQTAIREAFEPLLRQIERDTDGAPIRLYVDPDRCLQVDPRVGSGRLTLAHNGGAVEVIRDRFRDGESIPELAEDYGVAAGVIEAALRHMLAA